MSEEREPLLNIKNVMVTLLSGLLLLALVCCCYSMRFGGAKAEAYLRVNRELFEGTTSDFEIYRETQIESLKSSLVINAALQNEGIKNIKGVTAAAIRRSLHSTMDGSELLFVTLKQGRWSRAETETILNAVLHAYRSEVIDKERLQKVKVSAQLRKEYTERHNQIQSERTSNADLSTFVADQKALVADLSVLATEQSKLEIELNGRDRVQVIQPALVTGR